MKRKWWVLLIPFIPVFFIWFASGFAFVTTFEQTDLKMTTETESEVWVYNHFTHDRHYSYIIPFIHSKVEFKGPYEHIISIHYDFDKVENVETIVMVDGKEFQRYITKQDEIEFEPKRPDIDPTDLFALPDKKLNVDTTKVKKVKVIVKFDGIVNGERKNYKIEQEFKPEKSIDKGNAWWFALMSV